MLLNRANRLKNRRPLLQLRKLRRRLLKRDRQMLRLKLFRTKLTRLKKLQMTPYSSNKMTLLPKQKQNWQLPNKLSPKQKKRLMISKRSSQ